MQLFAITLPLFACACASSGISGDGKATTALRTTAAFTAIEVHGALSAEIAIAGERRVEVTADSNILDRIHTEVRGQTLIIEPRGAFSAKTPVVVRVQLPKLEALAVSGASDAAVTGLAGGTLGVRASGASEVALAGKVERLEARVSGASELEAEALIAEAIDIDASGASEVTAHGERSIDVEASGASDVEVSGAGAVGRNEASGASDIRIRGSVSGTERARAE